MLSSPPLTTYDCERSHSRSKSQLLACLLVGIALFASCITLNEVSSEMTTPPQMSVLEARNNLLLCLNRAKRHSKDPYQDIKISQDGFQLVDTNIEAVQSGRTESKPYQKVRSYRFSEIGSLHVENIIFGDGEGRYRVKFDGKDFTLDETFGEDLTWKDFCWDLEKDAMLFVDAIYALKYAAIHGVGGEVEALAFAEFQKKAEAWRALPAKPELSEETRRFKALAEDAFRNKNFEEAIEYYEQGLAVTPMWPEGHFNTALMYGELQLYTQAVNHMKSYLVLCPDAKDALASRDKMYVWEEKAKKAAKQSSKEKSPAAQEKKIK